MILNEKPDDLMDALSALPSLTPAAVRDARVRARCHAALTRREPPSPSWPRVFRPASSLVDAMLGAAVGVYAVVIAAEALKAVGLL